MIHEMKSMKSEKSLIKGLLKEKRKQSKKKLFIQEQYAIV